MELKNCAAALYCKNASTLKDFYVNVLGLTVIADFGGLNYIFKEGFAIWQPLADNIVPKLLGENIYNSQATSRFQLYFETTDLNEVLALLKQNCVRFLHEINEEIWGQRNIRFYDPEGHLIEVGESFSVFMKRVYEQENNDVEATCKRTGVSIEMLKQTLDLK